MRSYCLMETEFQVCKMKSSGDGQWRWLHNNVNVFNTTELYKIVKMANFRLCVFYHNKKFEEKGMHGS